MPWPVPWSKSRPACHSAWRAKLSSCAPLVPRGNSARAIAMWPFRTRVKCRRISGVRLTDRDGARDIGGRVEILAAGVDEVDRSLLDRPVGRLGDPVVRQRRVRARGRDGLEAGPAIEGIVPALRLEMPRGARVRSTARRPILVIEPAEEAADRRAVALIWASRAPSSSIGSCTPWRGCRARRPRSRGRRRLAAGRSRHAGDVRVDQNPPLRVAETTERIVEARDRLDRDLVAEALPGGRAFGGRGTARRRRRHGAGRSSGPAG